jgi:hypothetical protein
VATKNVAYRVTFSYTGVAIAGRAREGKKKKPPPKIAAFVAERGKTG